MTDTHDTNLPDKPVELEEDKKTAEVSEPATTETPAEVTLTDKPAESVQKLTKEEILNKLKAIAADVENAAKSEIDGLKQAFYKLHNSEQEAAKKQFVENGGAIEEFVPQADALEEEFKNITVTATPRKTKDVTPTASAVIEGKTNNKKKNRNSGKQRSR